MATTGLGNFLCDTTVEGGTAKFHFYDPFDASNTADTSVAQKDFPEGVTAADSRQVLDIAFGNVQAQLNAKRDERLKKEAADQLNKQIDDQATARQATAEYIANSTDISNVPATGENAVQDESSDSSNKKK